MIIRGGENISPKEIEELMITHPKVEDVAVVGMPDKKMGERTCAYIRSRSGQLITLEETVAFLREKGIASFKLPERLELVEEFPLTNVGKIAKNVLRDWIAHKLEEEHKS